MTTATTTDKSIRYDRASRDWAAYLNGEYIGSFSTHAAAEAALDQVAYDQLMDGVALTAAELDGGSDADTMAEEVAAAVVAHNPGIHVNQYTVTLSHPDQAFSYELRALCDEAQRLMDTEPAQCETTLIVHPQVLTDFGDYNDFLDLAEAALDEIGCDGVLQLASFHPDYQFAGTDPDDVTNATNRSPYPTLHLIREESIDRAVQAFPDAAAIYETNIATMEALGEAGWTDLLAACRDDAAASGCGATPSDPSRGQPS